MLIVSDLQRGLVGHWRMDGNAKDSTPYENHGTVTGATLTTDRKNQANKAYNLDGLTNFIGLGNPTILQMVNNITIQLWVKLNSTQVSAQWAVPISHGHTGALGWTWQFDHTNANSNTFLFSNGSGLYSLSFGTKVQLFDNTWHHLVGVKSSVTGMATYRDGAQVAANAAFTNDAVLTGSNVDIGRDPGIGTRIMKGAVDNVKIWNRALSPTEIDELYALYDSGLSLSGV